MAKTLADIQQAVKDLTLDDSVVFTAGFGRKMFNRLYRALAARFDWPELSVRAVLASATVVDQENYEWTGEDFPIFLDVKIVEINSLSFDSPTTSSDVFATSNLTEASARNTFKMIQQVPNEFEWNLAGRRGSIDTPIWFKRFLSNRHIIVTADVGSGSDKWHSVSDGTTWIQTTTANIGDEVRFFTATDNAGTGATTATNTQRLALRPAPSTAGYTIRVTGVIEPTELSTPSSATIFLQSSADDALEYLLAASWSFKIKNIAQGELEIQRAVVRLSSIFSDEQVTTETIRGLI